MFSFEALKAKHGDALLVHYGPEDNPRMIIIDGGPGQVFEDSLKPRLEQIAFFREIRPVPARLAMVSHIDNDHIVGIKKMLQHVQDDNDPVVDVEGLWHNSFDDEVGTDQVALLQSLGALSPAVAASTGLSYYVKQIAAGVQSGQQLRDIADGLGLTVNAGGNNPKFIVEGDSINLGHETTMRVLSPDKGQLLGLQMKWDGLADELSNLTDDEKRIVLARITENSLANISSIVVHIKKEDQTMLLTGDARSDHVISGMERANLLPGGKAHVSILKIPHHGSDRNVDTEFFETIKADHYIFSGDRAKNFGSNPDKATFQMVTEVRKNQSYTMHFTHSTTAIRNWIREDRAAHSRNYDVVFPTSADFGLWIDLDNELLWF